MRGKLLKAVNFLGFYKKKTTENLLVFVKINNRNRQIQEI